MTRYNNYRDVNYRDVAKFKSLVVVTLVATAFWFGGPAESSFSQGNHKVAKIKADFANAGNRTKIIEARRPIDAVIEGRESLAPNQEQFDYYFTQYYFPLLTQTQYVKSITSKDPLRDLARNRRELLDRYVRKTQVPEVHDHLTQLVHENMVKIVQMEFHPAVRYTAMLIIGDLNQREAQQEGDDYTPAVPLLSALSTMITELENPEHTDAVSIAGLIGVLRHVELDRFVPEADRISADQQARIFKLAMALASTEQPPEGRSKEAHFWVRRRAIEVLTALDYSEGSQELAVLLDTLISKKEMSLNFRCAAAAAIGRITLSKDFVKDPAAKAAKLGLLAVAACRDEIERLNELKDEEQQLGIGGRRSGAGMMMSEMGDDDEFGLNFGGASLEGRQRNPKRSKRKKKPKQDPRLTLSRRNLKSRLHCVQIGLQGPTEEGGGGIVALASDEQQQQQLAQISDAVKKLSKHCDDSKATAGRILVHVAQEGRSLVALVRRFPAANGGGIVEGDLPDLDTDLDEATDDAESSEEQPAGDGSQPSPEEPVPAEPPADEPASQ